MSTVRINLVEFEKYIAISLLVLTAYESAVLWINHEARYDCDSYIWHWVVVNCFVRGMSSMMTLYPNSTLNKNRLLGRLLTLFKIILNCCIVLYSYIAKTICQYYPALLKLWILELAISYYLLFCAGIALHMYWYNTLDWIFDKDELDNHVSGTTNGTTNGTTANSANGTTVNSANGTTANSANNIDGSTDPDTANSANTPGTIDEPTNESTYRAYYANYRKSE